MQTVIMPSCHHTITAQTLNTGERGMGTSQAAARERDKPPAPGSWVPAAVPALVAQEWDKLHTLWLLVPAAACGRSHPPMVPCG